SSGPPRRGCTRLGGGGPDGVLVGNSLLTWPGFDHLLDLLFHRVEVEGSRGLHRRVIGRPPGPVFDKLLGQDGAAEIPGEEVIAITPGAGVRRLAPKIRRALEWILANIDHRWHVGGRLFARPAPRLRIERELEVVEANRAQLRAAEIEQLAALGWTFAGDE